MTIRLIFLWVTTIVMVIVLVGGAARAASRAHGELGRELQRQQLLDASLSEYAALRARPAPTRSSTMLAERLGVVLQSKGLPASTMATFTPQPDQRADGLVRRKASFVLSSITLPQLGTFLNAWRRAEPVWVISSIDLAVAAGAGSASASGDIPLSCSLTIEGVFAPDDPPRPFGAASR